MSDKLDATAALPSGIQQHLPIE